MDIISYSIAKKANKANQLSRIASPSLLKPYTKTMSTPPTVTIGVSSGASVIANSVAVSPILSGTELRSVYKYLGIPIRADWNGTSYAGSFPDREFVKNNSVTNGTGISPISVSFCYDGSEFEFTTKGLTSNKYNILVDEGSGAEYVFSTAQNGPPSGGGLYKTHVNFGSRKLRRVTIEISGTYFGTVYRGPNDTIFPISEPNKIKAVWFGDSNVEGTGAPSPHESMCAVASKMLGWDTWLAGSGGTGFVNPGLTGRVKFGDRLDTDVIQLSPDIVIVIGGNNDDNGTYTDQQIEDEVRNFFTQLKTKLPSTQIIALTNIAKSGSVSTGQTTVNTIMRNVLLPMKIPTIDPINGITYGKNAENLSGTLGNWFTGGGNVSAPQATGNASFYVSADGSHCSPEGHRYMGERVATEVYRILNS